LNKVLRDRDTIEKFVKRMVTVTEEMAFDGWLVNIENPVEVSDFLIT